MTTLHINQPTIKTQLIEHSDTKYQLSIQPLLPGFGYTLGNSLRRLLLSSVPGFAVTRIKINDITHEYQAMKGIVEDALQVVLNLKLLRARITSDADSIVLNLKTNKQGDVLANDFEANAEIEIVNKDLYICSIDSDTELNIEVEITRGVGYLGHDQIKFADNTNPHNIYVDALFSPVSNVMLNIEQVRVGDKTNFDKVDITFDIDNTVSAKEIIQYVLDLTLNMFNNINNSLNNTSGETVVADEPIEDKVISTDTIDLPKRIQSILEKNDIKTNSQLKDRLDEIVDFPGITEKSLETIKEYLATL
jgi:DNA-directed RNA polymerase subunit alpha